MPVVPVLQRPSEKSAVSLRLARIVALATGRDLGSKKGGGGGREGKLKKATRSVLLCKSQLFFIISKK